MDTYLVLKQKNLNMKYEEWLAQASDLRLGMILADVLQGKPNTYEGNESKYYEECLKDN